MPITHSPLPPYVVGALDPQGLAAAGEVIPAHSAVSLVTVAGVQQIMLCRASLYAPSFIGFATSEILLADSGSIVTARGSVVTPIVEGAALLIPDQPVFLSNVAGQVTQTAPIVSGAFVLRVGMAVSTTQLAMLTDHITRVP